MEEPKTKPADPVLTELQKLVTEARAGNTEVLPALRLLLASQPEIWRKCADLEGIVLRNWIHHVSVGDPVTEEALKFKVEAMKAELAGTNATPVEKLLIGRIVVCWLQTQQVESLATQADGLAPKTGTLIRRRQKHAHRLFMKAIHTLAAVRRLQPNMIG